MKHILTALLLTASLAQATEEVRGWETNARGYAVRQAEETEDFVGINVCQGMIIFASPAEPGDEGKELQLKFQMRVDTESPWEAEMKVKFNEGLAMGGLGMDPLLLKELTQGQHLRVKWANNVYSRFDLTGLTKTLKTIKCDSEFFEQEEKSGDAKFFS